MINEKDNFILGECIICKKIKALKNGVCFDCEKKSPKMPEMFKDIFSKFTGDK